MNANGTVRYCGREFTAAEIADICALIAQHPDANRVALSRMVCKHLDWLKPDGGLKEMSCRVAMLRMQDDDLIQLPAPQKGNGNGKPYGRRTAEAEPQLFAVQAPVEKLSFLHLEPVMERKTSYLWNEYIDRYHYLGYQPLPGAQLRYFVVANNTKLALLGFSAAAWKTSPRDIFIGWNGQQRQRNLHLVINNARFLILPWVKSRNLASKVLSMAKNRVAEDWQNRYGYRPVLMETFVEVPRFTGACYRAANWLYLGETKGRGKLDVKHQAKLPTKAVMVCPLVKDFRQHLCR